MKTVVGLVVAAASAASLVTADATLQNKSAQCVSFFL